MTHQFGRAGPLFVALLIATGLLAWVTTHGRSNPLVVWTFDAGSAASYPAEVQGRPVVATVTPSAILNARLGARALTAGGSGPSHLVELEIGSVGKYFRGPPESTFLRPLSADDARGLLPERLAVWRYQGTQLALPRDVHPVALVVREDLWREAGLDPRQCSTWNNYIDACRRFEAFYAARGEPERRSLELPRTNAAVVYLMLQQRGVVLIDEALDPQLADPRVAETVYEYARWVAADIGSSPARTILQTAQDLEAGRLGALLAPDWKLGQLRAVAPGLAGKLALLPLPVFTDGDAPTASWGGTGVAVPRDTPDAAASLALIHAAGANGLERYARSMILPATPDAWRDPRMAAADGFWAPTTPPSRVLPELSRRVPRQVVTVLTPAAQAELNLIVARAVRSPEPGRIRADLQAADARLRARAAELRGGGTR